MKLNLGVEKTIIIVDDDDDSYFLEEIFLRKSDIKNNIIRFCDGEELLDFFRRETEKGCLDTANYVLLLDIRMPKTDGITVLSMIKHDAFLSRIPVIMVSASNNPKFIDTCINLGCSDYIVKPFDFKKAQIIKNCYLS